MLTSPTTCGRRCGASRRSTRVCRRSASWMMTWVYSVSSRESISISSSCAAPRMPPSGFLISCARLRISSLLACAWSIRRSSRSCLRLLLQRQQFDDDFARRVGLRHDHVHRHRLVVLAHAARRRSAGRRTRCCRRRSSALRRMCGSVKQSREAASPRWCGARCRARLRARRWQTAPRRRRAPRPPAWPAGRRTGNARRQCGAGLARSRHCDCSWRTAGGRARA